MKTIKEWLKTMPDWMERRALFHAEKKGGVDLNEERPNFRDSVNDAFSWDGTQEGSDFWLSVYNFRGHELPGEPEEPLFDYYSLREGWTAVYRGKGWLNDEPCCYVVAGDGDAIPGPDQDNYKLRSASGQARDLHYWELIPPKEEKVLQNPKKPPLSVIPENLHREKRMNALCMAIDDRIGTEHKIPHEWATELANLIIKDNVEKEVTP